MTELGKSEMEQRILAFVQTHPNGTWQEQIGRELEISRPTVSRYLTGLQHSHQIRVEQEGAMKRIYPAGGTTLTVGPATTPRSKSRKRPDPVPPG